jgi:hypothetical protein
MAGRVPAIHGNCLGACPAGLNSRLPMRSLFGLHKPIKNLAAGGEGVADIFVSYNRSDRTEALWIAAELRALGHLPHLHEVELKGGKNFIAWMGERLAADEHTLCVISEHYLQARYSMAELNTALKLAIENDSNFLLPVVVKPCKSLPPLIGSLSCCMLHEIKEDEKSGHFRDFIGRSVAVPVTHGLSGRAASNIPIRVP